MNQPLARRIAGITFAALGTVSLIAACGSSGKTATPTGPAGANGFQAYLTCLSNHGVTLNFPSRGPGGRPSDRPSGAPRPSRSPGSGFGGGFGGGGFGGGLTDPSQPPNGVDAATWSAAVGACKSLAPTGNPSGRGFNNTEFTAYRNCLADHGLTFTQGAGGLNTADPKIAAALKACEALRPTGRPSGAPTG